MWGDFRNPPRPEGEKIGGEELDGAVSESLVGILPTDKPNS